MKLLAHKSMKSTKVLTLAGRVHFPWEIFPARACASRSYVIGAGVHLYVCVRVYDTQKV